MEEARASWNTIYQDQDGFECQLTLRDDDEESLAQRVAAITARIVEAEGTPVVRRSNNRPPRDETNDEPDSPPPDGQPEKTYVDSKGVRRCNLKLKNGRVCRQPVTEREGRYGLFWSCPQYREHAPQPR